jgi:hypothetical protein
MEVIICGMMIAAMKGSIEIIRFGSEIYSLSSESTEPRNDG